MNAQLKRLLAGRFMTKLLAALALAVGFTTAATAATPKVVWDGDFDTTSKTGTDERTYTLDLQGNSVTAAGKLSIVSATKGAKISHTGSNENKCSVLIKYSGLAAVSGKKPTLSTIHSNSGFDIGLAPHTAGGLAMNGFYNNEANRYGIGQNAANNNTETLATLPAGTGYFLFTQNRDVGTAGYAAATIADLTGDKSTKLRWANNPLTDISIGGPLSERSNYPAWTGVTIEAVAVFYGEELTPTDVASFQFLSDAPKYNNKFAGEEAYVPGGSYGDITVPRDGIKATALTATAELGTSGTGISGNFNGIFCNGVNIQTHSVSGWFKVGELPASGNKLLWTIRNDQKSYGGYTVVVNSEGKIGIGRTSGSGDAAVPSLENNGIFSASKVIDADTWYYLTLSFQNNAADGGTSASVNRNATVKLFVNGGEPITLASAMSIGCNGGTTTGKFRLGAEGVSVAGFYINSLALTDVSFIRSLATCLLYQDEKFVPVTYTAQLATDKKWSELEWDVTPSATLRFCDIYKVVATEGAKLSFDSVLTTPGNILVEGAAALAADDALYVDGCWSKTIVSAASFAAENATFATLKTGFVGAYTKTATGLDLRAQNKEVISINIAGGSGGGTAGGDSPSANIVSGSEYYGIAPTLGDSWNNINRQWQGGNQTISINGPNAYDGSSIIQRPSMSLSATGKNTYQAGSISNPFLRGYLDDGNGVTVTVTGIPYSTYDVIVYATSDSSRQLAPVTINGTKYTFADGETTPGATVWGVGLYATPELGKNALMVRNCNLQTLTINATRASNPDGRATLCAVQVINMGGAPLEQVNYTTTVTESKALNAYTWAPAQLASGEINTAKIAIGDDVTDPITMTFDQGYTLGLFSLTSKVDQAVSLMSEYDQTVTEWDFTQTLGKLTLGFVPTGTTVAYASTPTVRFSMDYAGAPLLERGTVSYSNAALKWNGGVAGSWMLDVAAGDAVSIDTSYSVIRPTFSLKVAGGTVTFVPNGNKGCMWFGNCGATTYTQTDGEVYVNVNGKNQSGTDDGLLLGYTGSGSLPIDISGGLFAVTNSSINMYADGVAVKVAGGTVRTKGVFGNRGTITVGEGGSFELGSLGWKAGDCTFALTGGVFRAYENAKMNHSIILLDDSKIVAAAGTTLFVRGDVSGNYTLTVGDETDTGMVVFFGDVPASMSGSFYYGYTPTVSDLGKFRIPAGRTAAQYKVFTREGVELPVTVEGDYLKFAWQTTGETCWWDYEFNGDVTSIGTDKTTMTNEGTQPYYNTNGTASALWVGHATHYRGGNYPEEFTAVMYGKIVDLEKHVEIGFGSTTTKGTGAENPISVAIACGNPDNEEVRLIISQGFKVQKTVSMSVPNAYTSDHLYAFVCKTVGENENQKTKVLVYLDGTEWDSYTFDSKVVLGAGFQIGSVHGGVPTGYSKATTTNENSHLDFLRVYDSILDGETQAKYAQDYPYNSVNGNASRKIGSATTTWTATDAWNVTPFEGEAYVSNMPPAKAIVSVGASVAATATFNLDEAATYEQLKIQAGAALTLKTGGMVKPSVSGLTTIGADLTVDYDAIKFGNVMVAEGKTLTFDFASLDLSKEYASRTIELTGKPSGLGTITCANLTQVAGRTATFRQNPDSEHWELVIAPKGDGLTVTIAGNATTKWSELDWKMGDDSVDPDWTLIHAVPATVGENAVLELDESFEGTVTLTLSDDLGVFKTATASVNNLALAPTTAKMVSVYVAEGEVTELPCTINGTIGKTGAGTLKLQLANGKSYLVSEGTLKANGISSDAAQIAVTVEAGATFDYNHTADGRINVVMNGGQLLNTGSEIGTGNRQMDSLTLNADATIGGTGGFGLVSSQYGANTLALNEHTLTKTGVCTNWLCNTTITGAGVIDIREGALRVVNEDATFAGGTITSAGAIVIDNGRTFTVGSIVGGTVSAASGTLSVTGSLAVKGSVGTLVLGENATVKPVAGGLLAVMTAVNGSLKFDFEMPQSDTKVDLAKLPAGYEVTAANLPGGVIPKGWALKSTANGDGTKTWGLRKQGLVLIIK